MRNDLQIIGLVSLCTTYLTVFIDVVLPCSVVVWRGGGGGGGAGPISPGPGSSLHCHTTASTCTPAQHGKLRLSRPSSVLRPPTVALSHYHTLTLSHCRAVTLSHSHTVTFSHYHTVTLSQYNSRFAVTASKKFSSFLTFLPAGEDGRLSLKLTDDHYADSAPILAAVWGNIS